VKKSGQLSKGNKMPAIVDSGTCTGCGACVDCCPSEAIEMQEDKAVIIADKCVDCGVCVDECPVEAISME
jgi:Pyruvate/2-oxoacid:ferredoxin oxidoreductase delta subunit